VDRKIVGASVLTAAAVLGVFARAHGPYLDENFEDLLNYVDRGCK
jgi:hypothetical protein